METLGFIIAGMMPGNCIAALVCSSGEHDGSPLVLLAVVFFLFLVFARR